MFESLIVAYLVAGQPVQAELAERPVIVQVADQKKRTGKRGYDYQLKGYCVLVNSGGLDVFPGLAIQIYRMSQFSQSAIDSGRYTLDDLTDAKVSILKMPSHGQLLPTSANNPYLPGPGYTYRANPGYIGVDSLIALVEYKGQRIKVTMELVMVDSDLDGEPHLFEDGSSGGGAALDKKANNCLYPFQNRTRVRRVGMVSDGASDFVVWQQNLSLSALLTNAATAFQGFADLPGLSTNRPSTIKTPAIGAGVGVQAVSRFGRDLAQGTPNVYAAASSPRIFCSALASIWRMRSADT